jgi:5-methylcytosine-specific restriction endonuclease McrA
MDHEKKPKPFNKAKAKKELDRLFSKFIRNRDGVCQKCGSPAYGQCSHIITRTNLTTRWDTENAIQLCFRCHFYWWHRNPIEATCWIMGRFGAKRFAALKKRSLQIYDASNFRADYEKIKKELT